jgi:hypothetical protein
VTEGKGLVQPRGGDRPEVDWGEHVTDDEYAAAPATEG